MSIEKESDKKENIKKEESTKKGETNKKEDNTKKEESTKKESIKKEKNIKNEENLKKQNKNTNSKKIKVSEIKSKISIYFELTLISIFFLGVSFTLFPLGNNLRNSNIVYPSIIIGIVFYLSVLFMIIFSVLMNRNRKRIDRNYKFSFPLFKTTIGKILNVLFVLFLAADFFTIYYHINEYVTFSFLGLTILVFFGGILYNGKTYILLHPKNDKNEASAVKKDENTENKDEKSDGKNEEALKKQDNENNQSDKEQK